MRVRRESVSWQSATVHTLRVGLRFRHVSIYASNQLSRKCRATEHGAGARRTAFIMRAVGRNILRPRVGCILNVVKEAAIGVVPRANVCSRIGIGRRGRAVLEGAGSCLQIAGLPENLSSACLWRGALPRM